MNYLDYFIIAVVVFYAIWGISKGLLKIVLDFVGYIVAFLAAKMFGPTLVDFLEGSAVYTSIQSSITETFNRIVPGISNSIADLTIPNNMSELVNQEPGLKEIFTQYPQLQTQMQDSIHKISGEGLLSVITEYVVLILAIVFIFLVTKVIFSIIVSVILSRRDEMPLAFTNRVFGMVVGLAIAFILLSFGLQLAEVYAMTSSPVIAEIITTSKLSYIFTSVPLLDWLQKII